MDKIGGERFKVFLFIYFKKLEMLFYSNDSKM